MPALFDVPGPVDVHCAFSGGQPVFLGNCTVSPEYEDQPSFIPVMNDKAGRSKPAVVLYDGISHLVTCVMNRVDPVVYRRLRDRPTYGGFVTKVGTDAKFERGTIITGVTAFDLRLIFVNTYFGNTVGASAASAGRMYYSCMLVNAKETAPNRVSEIAFLFECQAVMKTATGEFPCYTEDSSLFGTLNPN